MVKLTIAPTAQLTGCCQVPGDKSISHRALLFSAISQGTARLSGLSTGADVTATRTALSALGVPMVVGADTVEVTGVGLTGFSESSLPLELGNSGTSMRLFPGVLVGQSFCSQLIGDSALTQRPMMRVVTPLQKMGAVIQASATGTPPLLIEPRAELQGIDYTLPVASAQVKSCLLLAGLSACGKTTITEPLLSRDHSERLLAHLGADIVVDGHQVTVQASTLTAQDITVPGDFSSAAFLLGGAAMAPGSDVTILNVGINPRRTGLLRLLQRMGAMVEITEQRLNAGEPVASVRLRYAALQGIDVGAEDIPDVIDELPLFFVVAATAQGTTRVTGAKELRVKESDRISAMAEGLACLGVKLQVLDDGLIIHGCERFQGGVVDSHTDHRIAMAFAMAGLAAEATITVTDCQNIATSFPEFVTVSQQLGLKVST